MHAKTVERRQETQNCIKIPASRFSRILPQIVSDFRAVQFSTLVEKLRKKRYSLTFDISLRASLRHSTALILNRIFLVCSAKRKIYSIGTQHKNFSLLEINSIYEIISWLKIIVVSGTSHSASGAQRFNYFSLQPIFSTSRKLNYSFINCTTNIVSVPSFSHGTTYPNKQTIKLLKVKNAACN